MSPFFRLTLFVLLFSGTGYAQFESALLSKLQLNLVNPGGKSLAMGGAFVSIADDATAAIANPAGLPHIKAWEAGLSGKSFSFEPTLDSFNYFRTSSLAPWGSPSSGDPFYPTGRPSELEFASVVGPLGQNLTVALYRAVNLRYQIDASQNPQVNAYQYFLFNTGGSIQTLREQGEIDIRNEVYGVSIGGQFDLFSIGVGLTLQNLHFDLNGGSAGAGYKFITSMTQNGMTASSTTPWTAEVESGARPGFIVGARVDLSERYHIALGAVYRYSPYFDMSYKTSSGTGDSVSCETDPTLCGTFKVPNDFSFGLSGSPVHGLTLAFEVQRIQYSQLNSSFVPVFTVCSVPTSPCPAPNRNVAQGTTEDITIPRIGAEYAFKLSDSATLNLRIGYAYEPGHSMKLQLYPDTDGNYRPDPGSGPANITDPPISDAFSRSFNGGSGENHVTFGLGSTIARHLSIDIGADLAPSNKFVTASLFYRF